MKTSKAFLFVVFIVTVIAWTPAHAGYFLDGTQLMLKLKSDLQGHSAYNVGLSTGYIIGVADAMADTLVCMPSNVTVKQTKQVVYKFMKSHPESWNNAANHIVIAALTKAWPCKK